MTNECRHTGDKMATDAFEHSCGKLILFVMTIILLCLCLPTGTLSYDLEKRVQRYTLKNGLKVLLLERHLSPTVSLYIRHRVGAVDEISGRTGTAHFLEHLMFKGTKTIGTRDYRREKKTLDKIAMIGNALDREKMKGENTDTKRITVLTHQLE
ncbi:MAG: hypothetical protein CO012_03295, partial [Syntrophobacterales bacterium CG_4_8_14_3_um_filter_49_14]